MLKDDIEEIGVNVNVVSKDKHVPEVERQNKVIKERVRAIVQMLPYKSIPKKVRIALIQYVVCWLNSIPKSELKFSPRDMILGEQKLDYKAIC
jgi:hypothetical protein